MESLAFRYKKPADWELLSDLAEQHPVPLIGNGDILTHYEVGQPPCCGEALLVGLTYAIQPLWPASLVVITVDDILWRRVDLKPWMSLAYCMSLDCMLDVQEEEMD